MKRTLLFVIGAFLFLSTNSIAQVYVDQFDDADAGNIEGPAVFTFGEADSELTINVANNGMWDAISYQTNDAGTEVNVDATGNNKVYIRAKASSVGTQLRMDLQDTGDFATTEAGITKTLTTEFNVLEFDFTGNYVDGGYGGTGCAVGTGPCAVDGSVIRQMLFYVNPGAGAFTGSVVIDYISFGEEPTTDIMSEVFQDHMDSDSSLTSFGNNHDGYTLVQSGSEISITGDGTLDLYDAIGYTIRNPQTWEDFDIDASAGDNRLYIKVKSTVDGTALRLDLQDIDGYITTQGSVTKIIGTEYSVFAFDYNGTYNDLGYGGTPCTADTAPCPVDPTRIGSIVLYINPGAGEFLGTLTIDYISFGTSLEPPGAEPELVYEDHFNDEMTNTIGESAGFSVDEIGTEMIFTGDGTAGQYAAISYLLFDQATGDQVVVDMTPAQGKVYVKAKTDSDVAVPLRIDLIDTANYHTSLTALRKNVGTEYTTYEYDFFANYQDGGYGGTACETGPCPVDETAITQVLFYVDPDVGGFDGTVTIDFFSIGVPLEDDAGGGPIGMANYMDPIDDNTSLFITPAGGITTATANGEWVLTGDGTSPMWTQSQYELHNDGGDLILGNVADSEDKIFIRAKASADGTPLRIDLQDNQGYVTNLAPPTNNLTTEYVVYEYNYSGVYTDGAYGGSPCMVQGCEVDGQRVPTLQFFIDPGGENFEGSVTIDWISFGTPLNETNVIEPSKLNAIKVFPNPASDYLNVAFDLVQASKVNINVYDIFGKLHQNIANLQLSQGESIQELDLDGLSAGMYILQLEVDGLSAGTKRFTKF